jgi:hypothetical protein
MLKKIVRYTRDVPGFLPNCLDCDKVKTSEETHDTSYWEFRQGANPHTVVLYRRKVSEGGVDDALDFENCPVLSSSPPWILDRLRKTRGAEIVLQMGQSRAEPAAGLRTSRNLIRNFWDVVCLMEKDVFWRARSAYLGDVETGEMDCDPGAWECMNQCQAQNLER